MRLVFPLLFVLFLALAGCRDTLVEAPPEPVGDDPDETTEQGNHTPSLYIKGPDTLVLGASATYRAELLPDAERYVWEAASGPGSISGQPLDALRRNFSIEGLHPGSVELEAVAFDENGQRLAYGRKTLLITY